MIPCTDFIPAYSEMFKFLEDRGGKEAVFAFWRHLSDTFLVNLRELVETHGIRGCWLYWSRTLNEEAADFRMELDEDRGEFRIEMNRCPSKGRLISEERIEPYEDYCLHCDVLYQRVLEPLGYEYVLDMSQCDEARCSITVKMREPSAPGSTTQ